MLKSNIVMMLLNTIVPLICGFVVDYDFRILFLLVAVTSIIDIFITLPLPNTPSKK